MSHAAILNREQARARFCDETLRQRKEQPSLEELGREVEVLRGKLQTLRLAHERIDREAQRLTEQLEELRGTIRARPGAA